ncbi:hypothetical protein [Bacillus kwashiorkori]|uniref:hypothetical protein n=1 Tax=Bacillus kwashiorkori TaxID=1522318 RepID=UPI00078184A0|nr:hypothetical protein [Bacillus kwashiorkori]
MGICPFCNGLQTEKVFCSNCSRAMEDLGKISDYFDDYSPYMETELLRLEDGYSNNFLNNECVHLFHCYQCGNEQTKRIKE